jgi:sugar lactone lactonase YvrE
MQNLLGPKHGNPDVSEGAPLWCYDGVAAMAPLPLPPVKTSNGLAFSPDGRTLYHADTPTKTIWACDYDTATGAVENQRLFASVDEGGDAGGPDGATVDAEGFYICAVFNGACLLRFDPKGRLERRIELPVRFPTMPAFGGADRSTLYVTSAAYPAKDAAAHPHAGALLAFEAPAPGLPTDYMPLPEDLRT